MRATIFGVALGLLVVSVVACSSGDLGHADATPGADVPAGPDANPRDAVPTTMDATVDDTSASNNDASDVDGATLDGADLEDGGPPDTGVVSVVGLTITPTSARLLSQNGARPMATFQFELIWSDGTHTATAGIAATIDPVVLGGWDRSSDTFRANGRFGGAGTLTARVGGASATASILVEIEQIVLAPGTSTTVPGLFMGPTVLDPARAAHILYPLDGAVMPQNVPPAAVQWQASAAGDAFRVRMSKPNVRVDAFTAYIVNSGGGFNNSWLADLDAWRRIAQSEPDAPAEISVDRWEAATGQVIVGAPVHVRFARAALLGSIYYWDIQAGRIIRINDGTANREAFMPSPQLGCVGCHSVSNSGRYMAGRFGPGENVGGVFDLTQNLSGSVPPTVFPVTSTTARWWFSSWSPDESRLVVTWDEAGGSRALRMLDPFRGTFLSPVSGSLPTGAVTHPAWSPDGTSIAYVASANTWGGENVTGDIWTLPVLGPDAFGAPSRVITATAIADAAGSSSANYPSWSPDSQLLAFAHGSGSRSQSAASSLFLARRDGSGAVRLDRALGGSTVTNSYQPRFSPFQQGGYFWLTFLSRRDYGNPQAGTAGSGRQQIWVAAIKESPAPGEDPSEVPYWLPGQDTASLNIAAFWAAHACREERESCAVDAECCSGSCGRDSSGGLLCAPPSGVCRVLGDPCTANEQCCDGVLCVDGTCGIR